MPPTTTAASTGPERTDGVHQFLELHRCRHRRTVARAVRGHHVDRCSLHVSRVVVNGDALAIRRADRVGYCEHVGVEQDLLPFPTLAELDRWTGNDPDIADVAELLDDAGLDSGVALAVTILDRVPSAVVPIDDARVLPFEDDRADDAACAYHIRDCNWTTS